VYSTFVYNILYVEAADVIPIMCVYILACSKKMEKSLTSHKESYSSIPNDEEIKKRKERLEVNTTYHHCINLNAAIECTVLY
jgi:hypothetical protein